MFDKLKEKRRLAAEQLELERQQELERIANMSEKEVLVEILKELKDLNERCDSIESTIRIYSGN